MTYNSVSELFTGICDAIRTKDKTTELINHTDIPNRILAINNFSIVKIDNVCPVISITISTPTVTVSEAQVVSELEV